MRVCPWVGQSCRPARGLGHQLRPDGDLGKTLPRLCFMSSEPRATVGAGVTDPT